MRSSKGRSSSEGQGNGRIWALSLPRLSISSPTVLCENGNREEGAGLPLTSPHLNLFKAISVFFLSLGQSAGHTSPIVSLLYTASTLPKWTRGKQLWRKQKHDEELS